MFHVEQFERVNGMKWTEHQIAGGPVFYKAPGVCGQYLVSRGKNGDWGIYQRIHTSGVWCLITRLETTEAAADWIAANEEKGCSHVKKKSKRGGSR